jgi:hypothetical protein
VEAEATWNCPFAIDPESVGIHGDTWYDWGLDGEVDLYYVDDWTLYCYEDNLYAWDPSFWGVAGWNWFSGAVYGYAHCQGALYDTYYDWGYSMDHYAEYGQNWYCYYGNLYLWEPEYWGYAGWSWYHYGDC